MTRDARLHQSAPVMLPLVNSVLSWGPGGVPGLATMAIALSALATPVGIEGGVRLVTALMVPVLAAIDIAAAYLHRSELRWLAVLAIVPSTCAGMAAGNMFAGQLTDATGRIVVGSILIALLGLQTIPGVSVWARGRMRPHQVSKSAAANDSNTGSEPQPSKPDPVATRSSNQPDMLSAAAIATGLFGGCATVLTNSMVCSCSPFVPSPPWATAGIF